MSATQTKEKQPCYLQLFSFPADCLAICLSHTGLAHILTLYVFLPNSLLHSEFVVMSHLLWLMSISCQSLNTLWHWACGLQACSLNHLRAYFFYSNNRYSNIKVDIYLWFLKTFFHSDTNRKPIFLKLSYFTSIRAFFNDHYFKLLTWFEEEIIAFVVSHCHTQKYSFFIQSEKRVKFILIKLLQTCTRTRCKDTLVYI